MQQFNHVLLQLPQTKRQLFFIFLSWWEIFHCKLKQILEKGVLSNNNIPNTSQKKTNNNEERRGRNNKIHQRNTQETWNLDKYPTSSAKRPATSLASHNMCWNPQLESWINPKDKLLIWNLPLLAAQPFHGSLPQN